MSTKKVVFIVGPTAIGKTALSIKLAQHFNAEIISCDSRQFYKELLIGSAPPSPKELKEVQHHFIHNLSISQSYNAGKYEIDAINKMKATLDELVVDGVDNNRQFCMKVLENNDYVKGAFDTGFIPKYLDTLLGYDSYE